MFCSPCKTLYYFNAAKSYSEIWKSILFIRLRDLIGIEFPGQAIIVDSFIVLSLETNLVGSPGFELES